MSSGFGLQWRLSYGYDENGNLWVTGTSGVPVAGNTPTANVFNGRNQMAGNTYDAAGNQVTVNGNTVTYDAENRQVTVTEPGSVGGGVEKYLIDGLGQRVGKAGPSGTTIYVYDAMGQLAAEYADGATSPVTCMTCYLTYDHLGSVRMITDQNGNVVSRHDFLPYGEEIPAGVGGRSSQFGGVDGVSQRFTGQMRDAETGEDYFNARMFGSAIGRFTSPDPGNAGADLYNPQTWNGYSYVAGNPLVNTDPSGMSIISRTSGDPGDCYSAEFSSPCGDPSGGWGGGGYDGIDIGIGGGGGGTTHGGGGGTISKPVIPPPVTPTSVSSFPGAIGNAANGFLDPAGVGALAADACITNPVCVATAGALGLGGYLVWKLSPPGPVRGSN